MVSFAPKKAADKLDQRRQYFNDYLNPREKDVSAAFWWHVGLTEYKIDQGHIKTVIGLFSSHSPPYCSVDLDL